MSHLTKRDKYLVLTGILLAMFLGALDQTIVATALPKIVEDLNGLTRYAWVATSYLVASTALVPVYGKLADMYSRRSIELVSISVFLAGSFLCGLSGEFGTLPLLGDGMNQLIIFRGIQGLGGAGLFAMAFIVIADLFPPSERGKYQGLLGAVFGISSVLGPFLGGLLTDHGGQIIPGIEGWRWVFYVNIPFAVLALWFLIAKMPALLPKGKKEPLDILSAAFLMLGLLALVIGLQIDKKENPWDGVFTLSLLVGAVILLSLFVGRSLKIKNPVLNLGLFKNKVFAMGNLAVFFLGGVFLGLIIFMPLFLINVMDISATEAGLSLLPLTIGLVIGSVVSGQLVSRFGHYKTFMYIGVFVLLGGIVTLSQIPADIGYWPLVILLFTCGIGVGPTLPLYTLAVQNAVQVQVIGQATSSVQFFRQVGGAVFAAVMGTILATTISSSFSDLMPASVGDKQSVNRSSLESGGAKNVGNKISDSFEKRYALLEKAVVLKDENARQKLLENPQTPEELKSSLQTGEIREVDLQGIKERMETREKEVVAKVKTGIKEGFTKAINNIYFFAIFLMVIGIVFTFLIPERKLRETNDAEVVPVREKPKDPNRRQGAITK